MKINDPVMYHLSQSDKDSNAFCCGSVEHPVPATITAVHDDGTVDLAVVEAGGRTLGRQRVAATVMHEPGAGYVVSAKVHDEPEIQTDESGATIDQADPGAAQTVETKAYTDGTTATGTVPLPDQSPAQQDAPLSPPARKWVLAGDEWVRTAEVVADAHEAAMTNHPGGTITFVPYEVQEDAGPARIWVYEHAPEVGWQDISQAEYLAAQQESSAESQPETEEGKAPKESAEA